MVPAQGASGGQGKQRAGRGPRDRRGNRIEGDILAPLGSIDYWFTVSGHRVHKTVHHYLLRATGGELTIENDPDQEAVDVAWVPIQELARKLSFPNERRIADLAREVLPEHL
jgi:8-oxo-dGTP pyrophosphatase MutT (NUDIX family)